MQTWVQVTNSLEVMRIIPLNFFPAWRLQPFDFVEPFFSMDGKKSRSVGPHSELFATRPLTRLRPWHPITTEARSLVCAMLNRNPNSPSPGILLAGPTN